MRYIFTLILFSSLSWSNAIAQIDSAAIAREIITIEQALNDALPGDSVLWKKYLDPKWHMMAEDGNGLFKKEFIKGFAPFPAGVSGSIGVTKPVFSMHGDLAVIHYVADEYEDYYGNKLHTTYGVANTWYKTNNGWMMLSSEVFEIPQPPPATKVNAKILKEYTGTYTMSDDRTAVVSFKNGTLSIKKKGRPEQQLMAEWPNIFFSENDARGRKVFTKNSSGEMLMLERRNGQDIIWKRQMK